MKPKILLYDIENTPLVSYTWGIWEQDVVEVKEEWYILSFAYKWLGEKTTYVRSLPDYPLYKKDPKNDRELMRTLWTLFNEADVVIGHNSNQHDDKKSNARFIQHGFMPPKPYQTVDTLKVARRYFKFDSNKLDRLGQYFNLGRKVSHEGFSLWLGCMSGDKKAWNKMRRYNKQDVILLEKIYKKMLPYITNHPNLSLYKHILGCPNCGSGEAKKRGFALVKGGGKVTEKQRWQCKKCHSWYQTSLAK